MGESVRRPDVLVDQSDPQENRFDARNEVLSNLRIRIGLLKDVPNVAKSFLPNASLDSALRGAAVDDLSHCRWDAS